jgi:hypothetical protein
MAGLLGNIGAGLTGLLGNPKAKDALLATFASGGDPAMAMQLHRQKSMQEEISRAEEERQLRLQQLQMQMRQQQEAEAQRRIGNVTMQHYAENPNAVAFGGPGATPQQQLAGLLSRGVDPQLATGLLPAAGKPTSLMQNAQAAGIDLNTAQGQAEFRRMLEAQQQQGSGASPYFTPVFTANGVQAFDNRTGMTVPSQGGTGAVPLPSDPAQQAEIVRQKAMAEMNAKFEGEVQTRAPQLMGSVGRLESLIKSVESGDASSGVLVGSVYKLTDPQTAILEAESIAQSVEALNGSGLAPVSNQELKTIREMFASASKTGEINKVLLNRSLQIARKQLATLGAKDAYFQQKKTLEGWRPEGFGAAPVESVVPAPSAAQQSDREARLRALREKHGGV